MYNWSVNTKKLRRTPSQYTLWKLESLINFGLNGEKINKENLIKKLPKLRLDPDKKNFLNFLLGKK